ncbi:MAG: hypothetical protein GKR97_20140 [Rhizobiaceae bacterium]|nr:hypothetical protein [Rhizobiaceae bacterium]
MFRVFVRHQVKDFNAWHEGYRKYYDLQRDLNMSADAVQRDVEDPTRLTVVHDFSSMDDVKRYMSLPNLKGLMDDIGVIGKPDIWITEKVL